MWLRVCVQQPYEAYRKGWCISNTPALPLGGGMLEGWQPAHIGRANTWASEHTVPSVYTGC